MTLGSLHPGQLQKKEEVVDVNAPLLPTSREEDHESVDGFRGATFPGAVFNLSTTVVGAGIMGLPASIKVLGLAPGLAMIIFVAFLTDASISMLLKYSRAGKAVSYGGVMGNAFGKSGRILLQIFVVFKTGGVLIIYMIIIGLMAKRWTSSYAGTPPRIDSQHESPTQGILSNGIAEYCHIVLCHKFKNSLRFTSTLSVALAMVFVAVLVGITIMKLINGSIAMPRWFPEITDMESVWKLFTVVPVIVTAYICHYNVHNIANELEDSSQMQSVVRTSLVLCSSLYIMTSLFGFLLFGDSTLDDVLANFNTNLGIPYSSILNGVVRLSYAVHLMLVYPIIFFALRLNLDGLLFPLQRPLVLDNWRFSSITMGLISIIYLGANFIPSIWDVFQITGATAAVSIGFIFPASITLRDVHKIATKGDKVLSVFIIILAVFSSVVAIYSDISSLYKKKN
ncbi:hypothetical protein ACLOJK_031079 [Asimina triloba]